MLGYALAFCTVSDAYCYTLELGGTQNFGDSTVYHGINNYCGILINTYMYLVNCKCSNIFSQVTNV